MKNNFKMLSIWIFFFSGTLFNDFPDLTNKEDLVDLGVGKIIEKDQSIIIKITLFEINENAIIYIKNESMHDIAISEIDKIEFPKSKWGAIRIRFLNSKPQIERY